MAKISIQFVCGCGFKSYSVEDAAAHSDQKHHEMSISGSIKPTAARNGFGPQNNASASKPTSPTSRPHTATSPDNNEPDNRKDFDDIRARLKR